MINFSREKGQRAIGCPGLDTPFEEWQLRNSNRFCTEFPSFTDIIELIYPVRFGPPQPWTVLRTTTRTWPGQWRASLMTSSFGQVRTGQKQIGITEVRDSKKDTVIGGHEQKESIMAGDSPIADASAYNRSLPFIEAILNLALKTQRKPLQWA